MYRSLEVSLFGAALAVAALGSNACSPSAESGGSSGGVSATGGAAASGGKSSGGAGGTSAGGSLTGGQDQGGFGAYINDDAGSRGGKGGEDCGSVTIDTSQEEVVTPGNVLVIFDQSESMTTVDFNNQARWLAASDALVAALVPNRDVLNIGAVFFPSVQTRLNGQCDVSAVCTINDTACQNPQIPFTGGTAFIDAWAAHWRTNPTRRGTPIDVGMTRGDEALSSVQLKGTTVVIFVTDGEPTCNMSGNVTNDLPAKWLQQGIKTYVIGLPGAGASTLQTIATAGGTNNYLLPTDGAQLQQQLSQITSTIVKRSFNGCEIVFNEKPPDPTKIILVVTDKNGQQFSVTPGPDGFELAPDASKASLKGATCTDALGGRFTSISFAFGCTDAPPLR